MKLTSKSWLSPLAGLLLAGFLISACGGVNIASSGANPTPIPTVKSTEGVTAEGRILPKNYAYLTFGLSGQIASLPVSEGQQVKKDDVLVSLDQSSTLAAAVSAAKFEQVSAQQALDTLNRKAGLAGQLAQQTLIEANKAVDTTQKARDDLDTIDYQKQIDDAAVTVQGKKDDLKDAQDEADKYTSLAPDNSKRKDADKKLEDARKAYDDAIQTRDDLQNKLDQARNDYQLALAQQADAKHDADNRAKGTDPDDLALAQSRLDNANAQLAAAQSNLDNAEIKAPFDGTVVDLNHLTVGQRVNPGQAIVTVIDSSNWYVETKDLTELDVVKLIDGQSVSAVPDALPSVKLSGAIESISQDYTEKSGDVLYTIRIKLDPTDAHLRWGMTVAVTFER
jgi:multidrug resistance efflux pump